MTTGTKSPPPENSPELIPGLPDEIAEQCLLHLSFPYQSLARSVSSTWNHALTGAAFIAACPASPRPQTLFVFAFDHRSPRIQWQSLDPASGRWFVLPPMPLPAAGKDCPVCPPAFAAAAGGGEIYVLGGMRADDHAPLDGVAVYSAAKNAWRAAAPMLAPRSFFSAAAVGDGIVVAGGGDGGMSAVERYDPAADRWSPAAEMRCGMARYDAAAIGARMYVTEGWTWPFSFSPRGGVYDSERDAWEEMPPGMRDGWTGAGAVVGGRLFVVSDYGDGRVKSYDPASDDWRPVTGCGVPVELRRPFAVAGAEERVYVAAKGMDVGIGTLVEEEEGWRVEWKLVRGPPAFADLSPISAHVLRA